MANAASPSESGARAPCSALRSPGSLQRERGPIRPRSREARRRARPMPVSTTAARSSRAARSAAGASAADGELGYGNTATIGDDETPGAGAPVDLGQGHSAKAISAGGFHTCALLDDASVRCWGYGAEGRLGYGNTENVGDNESPGSAGPVFLGAGRTAKAISAGSGHTCALLDDGSVRCWGYGANGALGLRQDGQRRRRRDPGDRSVRSSSARDARHGDQRRRRPHLRAARRRDRALLGLQRRRAARIWKSRAAWETARRRATRRAGRTSARAHARRRSARGRARLRAARRRQRTCWGVGTGASATAAPATIGDNETPARSGRSTSARAARRARSARADFTLRAPRQRRRALLGPERTSVSSAMPTRSRSATTSRRQRPGP